MTWPLSRHHNDSRTHRLAKCLLYFLDRSVATAATRECVGWSENFPSFHDHFVVTAVTRGRTAWPNVQTFRYSSSQSKRNHVEGPEFPPSRNLPEGAEHCWLASKCEDFHLKVKKKIVAGPELPPARRDGGSKNYSLQASGITRRPASSRTRLQLVLLIYHELSSG